ncbi:MAG: hypothetical protein KDC53_24970, partial [Saprospiraceae bacterium]|nr:hypothetical protein [Saprospiraceae bacterium]
NIIYYRINQSPLERCHIHQFWVASFEECTKDQLQIMASSNVPRKNYFFVSKKISRDHQQTWLDMGLGLLEVMTALF